MTTFIIVAVKDKERIAKTEMGFNLNGEKQQKELIGLMTQWLKYGNKRSFDYLFLEKGKGTIGNVSLKFFKKKDAYDKIKWRKL